MTRDWFSLSFFNSMLFIFSSSSDCTLSYSRLLFSYSWLAFLRSLSAIACFPSNSFISSWIRSYSIRNIFTSWTLSSSRNARYCFAFAACFSRGSTCFSISERISSILSRLCFSSSRFFCAAAFLLLYLTIPAASSKSSRLSSGFPLSILSICPCPIIEYPSLPIPVSNKSSWTSLSLQAVPFNRYSLSPDL